MESVMGSLMGLILAFALVQEFAANAAEVTTRGCVDQFGIWHSSGLISKEVAFGGDPKRLTHTSLA